MMNYFISAIIVSIIWAGNIWLDSETVLGHVSVHHSSDEGHFRNWIRLHCVGCALMHSSFMIYPAIFAELILDCSPGHSLFPVCQVASRVDTIP